VSPASPTAEAQLAALRALTARLAEAVDEAPMAEAALATLAALLPGRALAIRVLELRAREPARLFHLGAPLREGLAHEAVCLTAAALTRARLKSAVAASARLVVRERWDSPFTGCATGITLPLAAAGELVGVLELGYLPGQDARDADAAIAAPLADALAVALRGQRLDGDAIGLRDYQSRLLESAHALILGIDRSWRITVCNRALLELTGGSRDRIIGRDLRDFIPAEQRQALTSAFATALGGHHVPAVTILMPRLDARPVRTVWSIAPVGRAGGAVEAVVAIGQDESKIEALQHQVVRAERLATLGELAAGVVHELNNPLTSITVYAEYLVRTFEARGAEPADLEKLRRIGASAQRILRFSRDLVQYARPSGRDATAVDLGAVVRQAVSICEHLTERSHVEVTVDIDPELPVVVAVAGQLEQVLINLITNAVHAVEGVSGGGPRGAGGRIGVRARCGAPGQVLIEVADSGPGVAVDERAKIFEPFFTTKPDGKGTGLGLPIVKNIVDQHRGEISVDQADLGGASFLVRLPIA
jgi:PAS domain S-box-containing protein